MDICEEIMFKLNPRFKSKNHKSNLIKRDGIEEKEIIKEDAEELLAMIKRSKEYVERSYSSNESDIFFLGNIKYYEYWKLNRDVTYKHICPRCGANSVILTNGGICSSCTKDLERRLQNELIHRYIANSNIIIWLENNIFTE